MDRIESRGDEMELRETGSRTAVADRAVDCARRTLPPGENPSSANARKIEERLMRILREGFDLTLSSPEDNFFDPPSSPGALYPSTWKMMMRNVYSLGVSGIDEGTLDVRIERTVNVENNDLHSSTISYLLILK